MGEVEVIATHLRLNPQTSRENHARGNNVHAHLKAMPRLSMAATGVIGHAALLRPKQMPAAKGKRRKSVRIHQRVCHPLKGRADLPPDLSRDLPHQPKTVDTAATRQVHNNANGHGVTVQYLNCRGIIAVVRRPTVVTGQNRIVESVLGPIHVAGVVLHHRLSVLEAPILLCGWTH